jgi:transposase-like protein
MTPSRKSSAGGRPAAQETVPDAPSVPPVVSLAVAPVAAPDAPNPEVAARAARRRFSAQYKLQILRAADACAGAGAVGSLLRREGLYSSHLTTWRKQREAGGLAALAPKPRGRPAAPPAPLARRVAELERENAELTRRLRQAETIIDVQKKLCSLLGIPPTPPESAGSAS